MSSEGVAFGDRFHTFSALKPSLLNFYGGVFVSVMGDKSKAFAIRVIHLYQFLQREKQEFILSKQLLRSGTSIGANLTEADFAISHKEFLQKLYVSLKEAAETMYWLELLYQTDYLTQQQFASISADCSELLKMLTAATKTAKQKES